MRKLNVNVPDALFDNIEKAKVAWGYASKSEFFRHAIQQYLENREKTLTQSFLKHSPT